MMAGPWGELPKVPDWPCEAYGAEGLEFGAFCFVGGEMPQNRWCVAQAECHAVMQSERQRVFDRLGELAGTGDPDMVWLAGQFTSPEQLLNAAPDVAEPEGGS